MFLKNVECVIVLCVLVNTHGNGTFALHTLGFNSHLQSTEAETDESNSDFIGCGEQELRTRPGQLTYVSDGRDELCSLYLMAPADHVIELEFLYSDVDCDSLGDVAIFDGWILDDQIFPSANDHPDPLSERYISMCEMTTTSTTTSWRFRTKQNIAQVQFFVPGVGQGFRLQVNFKINYEPCNMMLVSNQYYQITLSNFGYPRNCTVLSLYPQTVQILYMNIGETSLDKLLSPLTSIVGFGPKPTCRHLTASGEDKLQLFEGKGVGSETWKLVFASCGVRETAATKAIKLRCYSSAVRLQSSGQYFNVVRFAFLPGQGDEDKEC